MHEICEFFSSKALASKSDFSPAPSVLAIAEGLPGTCIDEEKTKAKISGSLNVRGEWKTDGAKTSVAWRRCLQLATCRHLGWESCKHPTWHRVEKKTQATCKDVPTLSSQKQSHRKGRIYSSELGRKFVVLLSDFWVFGIRLYLTFFSCLCCRCVGQLLQDFFIAAVETWMFLEPSDPILQYSLSEERTGLNKGFQNTLPKNSICAETIPFSHLVLVHLICQTAFPWT